MPVFTGNRAGVGTLPPGTVVGAPPLGADLYYDAGGNVYFYDAAGNVTYTGAMHDIDRNVMTAPLDPSTIDKSGWHWERLTEGLSSNVLLVGVLGISFLGAVMVAGRGR